MDIILKCVGLGLAAITLVLIVYALVDIHRKIGFSTTRGLLWACAVIVGSLFGVVLYRYFREPSGKFLEFMVEKR